MRKAGKRTGGCGRVPNLSQDDEVITRYADSKEEGKHHILYFKENSQVELHVHKGIWRGNNHRF